MPPNDKKVWEKPEVKAFANADEAIAYYSERGRHEHVAAIKRLAAESERKPEEAEERRLRRTTHR